MDITGTSAIVTGAASGLGAAVAEGALAELAGDGSLVDLGAVGWMEPAVLARVRHRSLDRARAAVAPVPPAALQRLVLERAGMDEPGGGVDVAAGLGQLVDRRSATAVDDVHLAQLR